MLDSGEELDFQVIDLIYKNGFDDFGICDAKIPNKDKSNIESWIERKLYGSMYWYADRQNIRIKLENLGLNPKSVLVFASSYKSSIGEEITSKSKYKISRYALGKDYHKVLRKKQKPILNLLKSLYPNFKFRGGIDSLPIPEKIFARESGLGWTGKNTLLLNRKLGSYFFISVILTDLALKPTQNKEVDRCGSCNACVDACPTNALFESYKIDASKCISYLTIENKSESIEHTHNWIFGCDICQEVCPWNYRKAIKNYTQIEEFKPKDFSFLEEEILSLDENKYYEKSSDTALSRINYQQFKRNIRASK